MDACTSIGLAKYANASLLKGLAMPVAAGGGLGAVGGAMAGGEGNRMQGAALGAGLGAAGGALGHVAGGAMGRNGLGFAEEGVAKSIANASKNKAGNPLAGGALKSRLKKHTASPAHIELQEGLQQAQEHAAQLQRGGAMLGGVTGAATGMGIAGSKDATPSRPQAPNPYGY